MNLLYRCNGTYYIHDNLTGCHLLISRTKAHKLINEEKYDVKDVANVPFNSYYRLPSFEAQFNACTIYKPLDKEHKRFYKLGRKYSSDEQQFLGYDNEKKKWCFYTWRDVEEFNYEIEEGYEIWEKK